MMLMLGLFIFSVPAMILECDFHDIAIASLVGLNFGAFAAIVMQTLPFYMAVFTIIPTVLYMVLPNG